MLILNILLLITLWNLIISTINLKYGLKNNKFYCGVIGFSGHTDFDKSKIETLMLWNSLERGEDATGIYTPTTGVLKNSKVAYKFLRDEKTNFNPDKVFIGHVRAATTGSKVDKNAHPFKENNIVLVHNGTLSNPWTICVHYGLSSANYDVDSHVLCAVIGKENKPDVLSQIKGGAAIIFTDVNKPEYIYVFKNKDRPLFKGFIDGCMYISSIEESLEFIGCKNVKAFEDDILFTIKDGIIKNRLPIVNKPLEPPVSNTTYNNNHHYYNFRNQNINLPIKDYSYFVANISKFTGMYLRASSSYTMYASKPVNIKYGKLYRVEDYTTDAKLKVYDEDAVLVELGLNCFDYDECFLHKEKEVIFLTDLTGKNSDVLLFKKDQVAKIQDIDYSTKKVIIFSNTAKASYNISFDFVRALTKRDIFELGLNKNKKPDVKVDAETNIKTDSEEDDEETPNDNFEVDNDNYYDITYNSDEMRMFLEQQNDFTEQLLEFGNKKLDDADKSGFNKIIHDMQSHLISMSDILIELEDAE